jgi:hypothetical protein
VMNKRTLFFCLSIALPLIAMAEDSSLSLVRGTPLVKGFSVTAAPDHLRMSSVIKVKDTYYLYCDYIRRDDPNAPGSYSSSLHLFTSADLTQWKHRGEVNGPKTDEDSFGCVNVDVIYHDGVVYIYYLGIGKNGVETRKRNEGWSAGPDDRNYFSSTIMVAESKSPLGPFTKRTPILKTGPKGGWDSWKLVDPHVMKVKEKFYLYYKGSTPDPRTRANLGSPFLSHQQALSSSMTGIRS